MLFPRAVFIIRFQRAFSGAEIPIKSFASSPNAGDVTVCDIVIHPPPSARVSRYAPSPSTECSNTLPPPVRTGSISAAGIRDAVSSYTSSDGSCASGEP